MRSVIKQRIELTRQGEVPDGYKKTKIGIIPDSWKISRVEDFCQMKSGNTITASEFDNNAEYPCYGGNGFRGYTSHYTHEGVHVLIGRQGALCGNVKLVKGKFFASEHAIVVTTKENSLMLFCFYLFEHLNLNKYSESSAQPGLSVEKILRIFTALPSISEQRKIVAILSTQDRVIELYEKKIEQLQLLKKVCLQKMFPKQGRNVPEVRFPGFTEPWEQRKLGELFDFLQNNTLSRAELNNESGVAKNIHYGDILIKFGECIDISIAIMPFISSQSIAEKFKNSFLKNGDIIMADTAEDETVGKCSEVFSIQNIPIISGLHTIPMRPRKEFALGYLGYFMNSALYHDQLIPLMHGVKVTSISKGQIQNTNILYPKNINEQACLGHFFLHLDHLITLHQRRLDEEKRKKKALMQLLLTGIVRV
ncbi:MAG: restriction endonuclease subunit S [Victivallales bacterium]|nr:restriction endonuclease subunit S [Victivallales bacterium]